MALSLQDPKLRYILIYLRGCGVCNHLSFFLCADHNKLLPGWSHFAQFTIALINKDPKKSKYSELHDGFIVQDSLTIKAQVQVIREKIDRPFRCLDGQYRRELIRVDLNSLSTFSRPAKERSPSNYQPVNLCPEGGRSACVLVKRGSLVEIYSVSRKKECAIAGDGYDDQDRRTTKGTEVFVSGLPMSTTESMLLSHLHTVQ
uniref:MATH domain-containing protein n=1 Tax=Zea mays TaxID=4577 RepID=A0A804UK34_MAIZE